MESSFVFDDYNNLLNEEPKFIKSIYKNRKSADYYKNCHCCGVFVEKSRWVKKESSRGFTPVCYECQED